MLSVSLQHQFSHLTLSAEFSVPTEPAGITALFGPSGAGKTSIINAVAGLLKPDQAVINLNNITLIDTSARKHIPPAGRNIGYIFQEHRLFPHMNVAQNLLYAQKVKKANRHSAGQRTDSNSAPNFDTIVELLGLNKHLDRAPENLSGGEKQRVAIGRAILANPQLLLADEPLAALDETRKGELLPYFEQLRDELNIPILYVSHSVKEVARLASQVLMIEGGKITQQGSTLDLLSDPMVLAANPQDLGALIHTQVDSHEEEELTKLRASGETLYVPRLNREIGSDLSVRIPAHDVLLALAKPKDISALNILEGTISNLQTQADGSVTVSLDTKAGRVLARVTQKSVQALDLHPGKSCFAIIKTVAIAQT